MSRRILLLVTMIYYIVIRISGNTNVKFKVNLETMKECVSPNPSFPKERTFSTAYSIQNKKGKAFISGRHTVLAEVPFQNFSLSGYKLDNFGKRDLYLFIENLSCHNWISKAYLKFGNFRYYKSDCRVRKVKRVYIFKYLGHLLTDYLRDDADIERERRALAIRANMIARRFSRCAGDYEFRNIDMNGILHTFPNYNSAGGTMLYRMHLVHNSSTVMCNEILLLLK